MSFLDNVFVLSFLVFAMIAVIVIPLMLERRKERRGRDPGARSATATARSGDGGKPAATDGLVVSAGTPAVGANHAPRGETDPRKAELDRHAAAVEQQYDDSATAHPMLGPGALQTASVWAAGVYSPTELVELATGHSSYPAWIGMGALAIHPEGRSVERQLREDLDRFSHWSFFFALHTLLSCRQKEEPIVGRLLCEEDANWTKDHRIGMFGELATERVRQGEVPTFDGSLRGLDADALERIENALKTLPSPLAGPLRQELKSHRSRWIDYEFLRPIGRVWNETGVGPEPLPQPDLLREAEQLHQAVTAQPARSILVVGPPGVGKRTLLRLLGSRLIEEGWTVFEAGPSEVNAGQMWIGQLEERILGLTRELRTGKKAVWFAPEFPVFLETGRGLNKPTGALDALEDPIARGDVLVVGLASLAGYDHLALAKPHLVSVMRMVRIEPLPSAATRTLARAWASHNALPDGRPAANEVVIEETCTLAEQTREDTASPGNVLSLLTETWDRLGLGGARRPIEKRDVIESLSRRTGLPTDILDEKADLDLDAVRTYFTNRVIGQDEAIDCLVDRIAMIKAGLTDPTRPFGVFLFVGPTGTGKTEIAKALAEWLYGSASRLVRLDMSELQSNGDVSRIYGSGSPHGGGTLDAPSIGGSLVEQVRRQPFSVVLLDEFEKADAAVWDLFLQMFDDGRMTDPGGRTTSFRSTIVILTSNIGSEIPTGEGLGFGSSRSSISPESVQRAVDSMFRKEFLNRLDRVVSFRPLNRDSMRRILHRELSLALERRGLRQRRWAVEWDEGAIDVLLAHGFTYDMGARPLRRAIDRLLLEPLAHTIVRHLYPQGDQFLFVRARGDSLVVEFVDPDAPAVAPSDMPTEPQAPPEPAQEAVPPRDLRDSSDWFGGFGRVRSPDRSALPSSSAPTGAPEEPAERTPDPEDRAAAIELAPVRSRIEELESALASPPWQRAKSAELEMMAVHGFWESAERFEILGSFEYRDRIERALASARSLLERLESSGRNRAFGDAARSLAHRVGVLEVAVTDAENGCAREAFLAVEAPGERSGDSRDVAAFGTRLSTMYEEWAAARGMRLVRLQTAPANQTFREVFAISGLGAHTILAPEDGLHVYERPEDGSASDFDRVAVRVRVVPRPPTPLPSDGAQALAEARALLARPEDGVPPVVRRYREAPSPLVRDAVRGWRTGRIDRVLAGDFDGL